MTAQEIRKAYLDFFAARGHKVIPRALLVPQNDPTTLFTGSGMQPLIPYLLGEPHPDGVRLVDSQPVFRAQDIEEVGDNRHDTLFEMLGNWSLGDYFKADQFPWIFEFFTDVVGLDPKKLYVTTFIGSEEFGIPKDTESGEIWKKLFQAKGIDAGEAEVGSEQNAAKVGMPEGARIFYYDADKNWWWRGKNIADMPVGEPGGPSSEIFYLFDFVEHNPEYGENCHPNCDCGRFVEIGQRCAYAVQTRREWLRAAAQEKYRLRRRAGTRSYGRPSTTPMSLRSASSGQSSKSWRSSAAKTMTATPKACA